MAVDHKYLVVDQQLLSNLRQLMVGLEKNGLVQKFGHVFCQGPKDMQQLVVVIFESQGKGLQATGIEEKSRMNFLRLSCAGFMQISQPKEAPVT